MAARFSRPTSIPTRSASSNGQWAKADQGESLDVVAHRDQAVQGDLRPGAQERMARHLDRLQEDSRVKAGHHRDLGLAVPEDFHQEGREAAVGRQRTFKLDMAPKVS